jgi:hypothetical protein
MTQSKVSPSNLQPLGELQCKTALTVVQALFCCALTSIVVQFGVAFGHHFIDVDVHSPGTKSSLVMAFANHDGVWYRQIVTEGYSYSPNARSPAAFFPLYPLLAASLSRATGLAAESALLIVSHVCLAAAFALTAIYLRQRLPSSSAGETDYALLSLGLMPATLFFRMTYSESLFVFLSVLALLAMVRRWPLLVIASIIGLATAARPVGVGLLAPFVLHCWHRCANGRTFLLKMSFLLPAACWGIAGFAIYQAIRFGEPLAFVKAQSRWGSSPHVSERVLALLSFQPIWEVYVPGSPSYWGLRQTFSDNPVFCWAAVNPVYFVLTVLLVLIGACKRWLSSYEVMLAAALLLIPYCTRSYEMEMASQARFAASVFPAYLVLGNLLACLPRSLAVATLGVSAFYMGIFSALFGAWHRVF